MKTLVWVFTAFLILPICYSQNDGINKLSSSFKIVRLKYSGGGDWYNDPSAEVNMMDYLKKNTTIDVDEPKFYSVDVSSDDIFNFPFIVITGHGNISFSDSEVKRLKLYLERGGFIYADDDYGMDKSFRKEMEKIFPGEQMQELPFNHKIYSSQYNFPNGLPKIHEHDGKPPQGFGYYLNGRLCVYYTYETNITDGWAEPREHEDPPEKRDEAFKMGTNIIVYVLNN
ncbi:MAG: DUF4159 domain-containing protein [Ignavibacteria bacterium]|nr:DUF4159 domain-containing protein [Ignavibacteria bacterium]